MTKIEFPKEITKLLNEKSVPLIEVLLAIGEGLGTYEKFQAHLEVEFIKNKEEGFFKMKNSSYWGCVSFMNIIFFKLGNKLNLTGREIALITNTALELGEAIGEVEKKDITQ